MAPAVLSPAPITPNVASPLSPSIFSKSRRTSGFLDSDSISNHGMSRSVTSRRVSSRKFQSFETSNITNVVHSLKRRSGDEIGATASSKLLNATHASLIDWIRTQRMSLLPPEGSNYDKVLAWAQLFVDRLHSFDLAIEEFAGDSYLAAQLAYGYCALLLELGKGNENALMTSFGFFYSTSTALVNLLERIELFNVTQEIREQLVLALADLVTLVASVATYFHQAIRQMTGNSATVNIYMKFPGQIQAFRQRCEKIAESMWRHQLQEKGLDGAKVSDVKTIRSWLAPEDTVLANVAETTSHLAHDREEMTCVWVGPHLTRFLRNRKKRTFVITGKSGSGKTVLSSVIVDHLQHPIGGVMHKTLYIPINGRLPAETRPRAIVKTILFQLFEKRIGNIQLFQILWDALERSKKAPNDNDYDNILWNALEHALAAALKGAKELVIVIDGVDEAACDEAVLLQKLTNATAKATNVKLITLGAQHPPNLPDLHHYHIIDDGIYEDICAVVRGQFKKSIAYDGLDEMGQSLLVSQITSASKGSFLWAKLASKRVRDVDNADNLRKAVDALVTAKPSITDLVLQILNELPQSQTREDAKLMLLWLATANRPLSVKELKALASIQPEKQTITEYTEEPRRILHSVNSLVFLQEDQVLLRHSLIRTAILDIFSKGKLVPAIKDRHADLVTRLLVYIKATITQPHEPSLTPLDWHDINPLINKHPLLEFSIRYWITHFRQTNVFVNNGEVPAAKEFAKLFPSSITVFLLQNTLWENRPTPELLAFTTTVTNVCRQILTNNHVVTLQLIITLAFLYRQLDYNPEAIPLFYEATIISRNLLTIRHLVTMKMAATFLEITTERVTSTKTEIMTKREEILLVLVECYKHHYDSTHENVINTLKQLVEHYRLIKEDKKAEEFAVTIQKFSGEYSQGRDTYGNLNVHLHGGNVVTAGGSTTLLLDIEEHDQLIEVEAWSFEALIKQAERYVAEGNFELAERTYVEIWQRLSRESRVQYSAQVEERKIQSVLAYTQFLKTQKREYEASSILSSVWQEYEQTTMALSETSVFHLQEMAKVMKTVGLATLALTVFKHCSHYYQSTNRTQSSTYQEIQQSIRTTSKEVMQSFSSSSTTVTSETTLEEMVYEASTSITTVDQTSFSATQILVSLYVEQRRWQDATRVIKKVLHGVWSSLFAPSLQDVTLPAKHVESCIELAERLSHCYHSRRRLTKEEDIRVRIYRAVRSGRNVDDKLRERITNELLRLFERTSQTDKIINLRQETLNDYTKHYGPENPLVVKILWNLAELTRPRPVFVDYYQQIIRILNNDSSISHPEAFEPLVIVATELWKQGRYSDALHHYQIIFTTFLSEPKQSPRFQDQTFVHEFFDRYTHCLRSVRTEFSVLHQVTVEYQTKCKAVFSATASITLKATLTLAKLCQESKRYELEAISLYEELLKTKSEEIDLQEISSTLDAIYEEQAAIVTSTKTESFSSTQVERAVKVLRKRISTVRETHGWAHEESLTKMEEMIKFHAQRNETQTVVQELKEATVQILSSETSSTRLIAAATTIASSYIATNQIQKATELTQEIYRQIVMKDTSNSKSVHFDLSSKERQSLTFLAQLEYSLRRSSSTTITEILAALTTEYVYFEEFRKEIKSKSSFHSLSVSAARLYQFLIAHERHTAAARVLDDFVAYFINTEGKRAQLTEISQVKIFVLSILDHFSAHRSENFIRSVGITSNDHVVELLKNQQWETASDLALAAYKYIIADASYHTPEIVKFVFTLGLNIGGRDLVTRPDEATRKNLLQVSGTIIQDALRVITSLKINVAGVSLVHLNKLIGLLGEQQDYRTLAWLLTILWNSREAQRSWPTSITLALGRRFIMARYLIGDYSAALRLAEDIVYNCRRVHGPRHLSTLEMSILLSQLYTGNAQRYQAEKNGQEIANRFYKKSAAVHENILRVFSDPDYAELEGNDSNGSFDGSAYGEVDGIEEHNGTVGGGEHVRQHLHLLKLSVERLGDWPKDYAEYEKLNADVFRVYNEYLVGVEGVEKWNLKNFGGGKAESNEDALDLKFKSWELVDTQHHAEIEEEL